MQQNGGNLWDAEGNPTFDDPKAIEALELLKEFRDAGITLNDAASDQATYDTMINGTVATYLAPTWWTYFPKTFAPDTAGLWGGIPLPAFEEGGARSTNVGGTSLIIPSQSKNGAAAWAFLNFWLLRPESRLVSYENGGYLFENIYKPVADDPIFQEPDEFVGGDKWLANAALLAPEIPGLNVTDKSSLHRRGTGPPAARLHVRLEGCGNHARRSRECPQRTLDGTGRGAPAPHPTSSSSPSSRSSASSASSR